MQPTDQRSTETELVRLRDALGGGPTRLVVVHPVEHDLRGPVPPGGHVTSHLVLRGPSQAEV